MQEMLLWLRAPGAQKWRAAVIVWLALTSSGLGLAQQAASGDDSDSKAIRIRGSDAFEAGSYDKAAELYRKALEIALAKHNEVAEGRTLYFLGRLDGARKDWTSANKELDHAASLLEKDGQTDLLPGTLFFLAHARENLGDYGSARRAYERTVALASGKDKALALLSLAMTCQELGDNPCAMDRATEAADAYHASGDANYQANALSLRGSVETASGLYEESLTTHRMVVELLRSITGTPQSAVPVYEREANALSVEGQNLISLGRLVEALEVIDQARTIQQQHGMKAAEASMDLALGSLFGGRFDHSRSLAYFRQAQGLASELKDNDQEADARLGVGEQEFYLGKGLSAVNDLKAAIQLAQAAFDREREAMAQSFLAKMLPDDQALALLEQSVALWKQIAENSRNVGTLRAAHIANLYGSDLRNLAVAYAKAKNVDGVNRCLAQLRELAIQTKLYPAARVLLLQESSMVARLLSKADTTLAFDEEAMAIAEQIGDDASIAQLQADEAGVHAAQGKTEFALAEYDRSTRLWDRLRDRIAVADLQSGESNVGADAYAGAVELNMRTGRFVQAFDLTERVRARAVLNQMQYGARQPEDAAPSLVANEKRLRDRIAQLDLEMRSSEAGAADPRMRADLIEARQAYEDLVLRMKIEAPRYASAIGVDAGSLKELQPLLASNVTLVSYFVAQTKVFGFVVTRSSFAAHELPIDSNTLSSTVRASLSGLRAEEAQKLYTALIAPLCSEIKTPLVGIIPHGALNRLSFAALTPDGRTFFADEHALFYLPSATTLKVLERDTQRVHPVMLAISNAHPGYEFGALPHAAAEAQAVATLFAAKAHDDATAVDFRQQAAEADYIHIAAHAELIEENPEFTRLVLKPAGNDSGFLTIADIRELQLQRASLVTLSACDTARGVGSIGDDFQSLNRAFLIAGVRSVVASLWRVNDKVSSDLMIAFYAQLRQGKSKAEALSAAERAAREANPGSRDWAAFVLSGRPGGEQ